MLVQEMLAIVPATERTGVPEPKRLETAIVQAFSRGTERPKSLPASPLECTETAVVLLKALKECM